MRTYYRASGGLDAAVQGLIFWAVLLTSPIWIVGIGGLVAYEHFIDEPKRARVNAAQMEASKPAREAARLAELQAKEYAAIRWDDARPTELQAKKDAAREAARLAKLQAKKDAAREAARLAELQAKEDAAIRWDAAQKAPWPLIKCDAARASLSTNTSMAQHGYGQTWADRALTDQETLAAHCIGNP